MMRIAIDYTAAVQQSAGIGRYVRNLIRALSDRDRQNDYVLYSAGGDRDERPWPDNFRRIRLPITDRQLAIIWQRLRLPVPVEWVTGRVDVLHSPDFVLPPTRRARTVLTVHDLSFMRYPECSSPALLEYLMRSVPRSVSRADLILADSKSTQQDLVELLGVSPTSVDVVYPGFDARFTHVSSPNSVLARYGILRPYVLAVGTLQPRKNYPTLIRAFAALRAQHRVQHQLVIAGGRGWLYDDIEKTIDEVGLRDHVLLTGFVDDGALPALYSGADLLAFPSLYEGFGIPVLEAMGCDTPVVTANVSSMPEVAGDAALLVDPADKDALSYAMWQLIDDTALAQSLVARGRERIKAYTWEGSARRLMDAYHKVSAYGG